MISNSFYKDNFFVITSDNYFDAMEKIYGYVLVDDAFYANTNEYRKRIPHDCYGCYVNIYRDKGQLYIQQDYFGQFGLYLYQKNDFWAISNSFLYLISSLEDENLTFDYTYALSMCGVPSASVAYKRTMVEEIHMLARNCVVSIEEKSGTLRIELINYNENSVNINTIEALSIIDEWHTRWNKLLKSIVNTEYVQLSLSGGKDSRVSLATMQHPTISFDNLQTFVATDKLYTHSDDYRIANEISNIYSFDLNAEMNWEKYKIDPEFNLEQSLMVKCGFHREIMPTNNWYEKPLFRITGTGGDLRELWQESVEDFIEKNCKYSNFNSVKVQESLREIMEQTIIQIDADATRGLHHNKMANDYFYKEGRQRNHNGKANVESFLGNQIVLSPLMDPVLYQINQQIGMENDNDLLYAIIYHRYLPELQNVGFDSGRTIKEETVNIAKIICDMKPIDSNMVETESEVNIRINRIKPPRAREEGKMALDYLQEAFYSNQIKDFVCREFGEELYRWADNYYNTKSYHPYMPACALVEIYMVWKITTNKGDTLSLLLNKSYLQQRKKVYKNNGILKEVLDYLSSIRIDIKLYGQKDNEIILNRTDDGKMYSEVPDWFRDDLGIGIILQSYKGELNTRFLAKGNGKLRIVLKAPWIRDDNTKKPLPLRTDIVNLEVKTNEGIVHTTGLTSIGVTDGYVVEFDSVSNEVYEIRVKWLPYIYDEIVFGQLITDMLHIGISNYIFWKKK